jgi:pre-rRNA-processing protein TSR4
MEQTNVAANVPSFGLGTQIFGEDPSKEIDSNVSGSEDENEESDDDEASSLVTALTRTVISDSPWRSAPAYKPVYLSTISEYLPPQPKQKLSSASQGLDMDDATGAWMSEKYENSLHVDPIFERFTRRVATEGEQCVRYARLINDGRVCANNMMLRYELGGVPLAFASDEVYRKLFPPAKHVYEPSGVEACPGCQSKRVFECQLMPNLINVVRPRSTEKGQQTDEERRAEISSADGMSWGTCLVFSCSHDCSLSSWVEEAVYIEWDV